jgi:hypothetical protein
MRCLIPASAWWLHVCAAMCVQHSVREDWVMSYLHKVDGVGQGTTNTSAHLRRREIRKKPAEANRANSERAEARKESVRRDGVSNIAL